MASTPGNQSSLRAGSANQVNAQSYHPRHVSHTASQVSKSISYLSNTQENHLNMTQLLKAWIMFLELGLRAWKIEEIGWDETRIISNFTLVSLGCGLDLFRQHGVFPSHTHHKFRGFAPLNPRHPSLISRIWRGGRMSDLLFKNRKVEFIRFPQIKLYGFCTKFLESLYFGIRFFRLVAKLF